MEMKNHLKKKEECSHLFHLPHATCFVRDMFQHSMSTHISFSETDATFAMLMMPARNM